jgi:hypothetical protein
MHRSRRAIAAKKTKLDDEHTGRNKTKVGYCMLAEYGRMTRKGCYSMRAKPLSVR